MSRLVRLLPLLLLPACGAARSPRHVVIVCIDTLRVDHVGSYGYERDTTPFLDRLSRDGMVYRRAFTPSNWTVPAVASLLTSLYPPQHGAYLPGEIKQIGDESPPQQLVPEVRTLADHLSAAGFSTALFSANPFLYGRFKRGFATAAVERVDATTLTDRALAWLRQEHTGPLFLYLQYMDAHQPNDPPQPFFDLFATPAAGPRARRHTDWSHGNQLDLDESEFQRFRAHRIALYDGSIRFVDSEIARLVDELSAQDLLEETLLLITSDHGEEFWDHAREEAAWGDDPRGLWGIGHGHSMYQELLHVPLIVRGPGFRSGAESTCAVSLLDLAPTVLAALGQPLGPEMVGRDLPHRGNDLLGCRDRALAASSPAYGPESAALLLGNWKLGVRGDHRPQLFYLGNDPGERNDLSPRQPKLTERLLRELQRILAARTAVSGAPMEFDLELRRQLEALGYL